ncbi:MAG TPA: hypothetical protein VHI54_07665 [Actinomycetota bacterium]|nr:hypothetical protein [Actinomycetota bacterium]
MTDVVLSVCILAVHERRDRVTRVMEQLGAPAANVDVVFDERRDGPWLAGQEAWERRSQGATHHLVLEDDALPCGDLYEGTKAMLRAVPDAPVMLYATTPPGADAAYREALATGRHWVRTHGFWTVAPVLPVELIDPIFDWARNHTRPDWEDSYDKRLSVAVQVLGIKSMVAVPSPVSHDWSIPSIRGHDHMKDSWPAIPSLGAASALGIDWRRGADDPVIDEGLNSVEMYRAWIV